MLKENMLIQCVVILKGENVNNSSPNTKSCVGYDHGNSETYLPKRRAYALENAKCIYAPTYMHVYVYA